MEIVDRIMAYDSFLTLSIVVLYASAVGIPKIIRLLTGDDE